MRKILLSMAIAAGTVLGGMAAERGEFLKDELQANASFWRFDPGADFPGAGGALEKHSDHLLLQADFSRGGQYVGAQRLFNPTLDFDAVRFQIKTPARQIGFRVLDGKDQAHQQYIPLSGNPEEVQSITIEKFNGGKEDGFVFWGGDGDGNLAKPVKAISFLVSSWDVPGVSTFDSEISAVEFRTTEKIAELQVTRPDQLFFDPGSVEALTVPFLFFPGKPEASELAYRVLDYCGSEVASGIADYRNGSLTVEVPPQKGFFEYDFPAMQLRFGAVALPEFQRQKDPFFGIDAVFSGFTVFTDEERYRAHLTILSRFGIGCARERMYWAALEYEKPGIDWQSAYAQMAEAKRRIAQEHGISIMELFHDAPPWIIPTEFMTGKYPSDLSATAQSWRQILARWGGFYQTLEVWNEPDHGFLPGDQQIAMQKAIAYSADKVNPKLKITGGVFSGGNTSEAMIGVYVRNGLLEVSDAVSFHNYDPAGQLESRIVAFRRAFGDSPRAGIPLELTECGWPWPSGSARALEAADRKSAVYIAMKAVEAKACGVAAYYPFVFTYYDEGVNNFGMMDRNSTPMRSMAAYLQAVAMLSGGEYIGDLAGTDFERARVFAFQEDSDAVVVLYHSPDKGIRPRLPESLAAGRLFRVDGAEITEAELSTADALLYVRVPRNTLPLNTDTVAGELLTMAKRFPPAPRRNDAIVLQGYFAPENVTSTVNGYFPIIAAATDITFIVNNLSEENRQVPLRLTLPPNAVIRGDSLPEVLEVAGNSARRITIQVDLSAALSPGTYREIVLSTPDDSATALSLPVSQTLQLTANAYREIREETPYLPINPDGGWFYWGEPAPNHRIEGAFRWFYRMPDELILDVKVKDLKYHQPFALHEAWKGDSVQVALQPLTPDGRATAGITEIVAAAADGKPGIFRFTSCRGELPPAELKKSHLEFRQDQEYQYYRLILNIEELGLDSLQPPKSFGASLLINSHDGTGRVGYLQWGGGIGAGKNPHEFNRIKMVP